MPILNILGWEISNLSEIVFDKRINNKKVDYIIAPYSPYKFIIEVKALGTNLEDAEENLLYYALMGHWKMAVLTDGNAWRFYLKFDTMNLSFSHKNYYGFIKFKINKCSIQKLLYSFTNILSKDKVQTGENLKYLKKIITNSQ